MNKKELKDMKIKQLRISTGIEAKLLQYKINMTNICETPIQLKNIIDLHFFQTTYNSNTNTIMINIEEQINRYEMCKNELHKISCDKFLHLKATYWKKKSQFVNDVNFVINFLNMFNKNINTKLITTNAFSETNDENIYIQDGPLACYCSHLRAMIYGFLNFKNYTVIVEDDAIIKNTENIEKYIKCIPDDWDIICLGAIPKNIKYDKPYYKFTNEFHSTHFYIINNKCYQTIFQNMYPIYDQVDVLLSNLINILNIYNIPNSVYQKDVSTNTQNNLHAIFNSPNYDVIRIQIKSIRDNLTNFINKELSENEKNNEEIINTIMFDVLYFNMCGYYKQNEQTKQTDDNYVDNEEEILETKILLDIYDSLLLVIGCTTKGCNVNDISKEILNSMINTIRNFKLHNAKCKAINYGASACVYLLNDKIIAKAYYDIPRWTTNEHTNSSDIFNKELQALKNINMLLDFDIDNKILYLEYFGKSLYQDFNLPEDWENQLENIFEKLSEQDIFYPEFNIKNILIDQGKIKFIDFGLAQLNMKKNNKNNTNNCQIFIELLNILNSKLIKKDTLHERQLLYDSFINNIKIHKIEKYLNNVF